MCRMDARIKTKWHLIKCFLYRHILIRTNKTHCVDVPNGYDCTSHMNDLPIEKCYRFWFRFFICFCSSVIWIVKCDICPSFGGISMRSDYPETCLHSHRILNDISKESFIRMVCFFFFLIFIAGCSTTHHTHTQTHIKMHSCVICM